MAVTSFQDIKNMSAAFRAMLNTSSSTLPFNAANTQMVILADVATDLQTILQHNPAKLALIIGLQNGHLTVCLLGADENGQPMRESSIKSRSATASDSGVTITSSDPEDEELPGEETWPDDETITNSENSEYDDFFNNP
jgi:hypothetical protein